MSAWTKPVPAESVSSIIFIGTVFPSVMILRSREPDHFGGGGQRDACPLRQPPLCLVTPLQIPLEWSGVSLEGNGAPSFCYAWLVAGVYRWVRVSCLYYMAFTSSIKCSLYPFYGIELHTDIICKKNHWMARATLCILLFRSMGLLPLQVNGDSLCLWKPLQVKDIAGSGEIC